ncbi:3089_t:CDS:2, partial [Cetraspora pellucida]
SKITLDDKRFGEFRKLKFVCKTFYDHYYYYFNKIATRYYLIQKYNSLYSPPTSYKWNVRYCPKNIWIDIDKDGSRFSHKLRVGKQLYVETNYLKNFKRTLIFVDAETFCKYGKSRCQNCKSYTYCETQGFTFFGNTESDCKKVLKKLVQPTDNDSYLRYSVNVCEYCDSYLTALYRGQNYDALLDSDQEEQLKCMITVNYLGKETSLNLLHFKNSKNYYSLVTKVEFESLKSICDL